MKTIPTVEGKMYCVSATIECTITSQSGTVLGTASPGTPFWFQAQKGETTTLSDDAAEYSASRFNSAPQQQLAIIGVLGGGTSGLPAGYTRVEYLEADGGQYMDTKREVTVSTRVECECQLVTSPFDFGAPIGASWRETDANGALIALHSAIYFTEYLDKRLFFAFGDKRTINGIHHPVFERHRVKAENAKLYFNSEKVYDLGGGVASQFTKPITFYLFGTHTVNKETEHSVTSPYAGRVYGVTIYDGDIKRNEFVPCVNTNTGEPCMYDLVSKQAFKNAGSGQFVVGMTLAQVRGLRLPAGGGKLTLSLPHEASIDKLAQAALERARANGWELTLQYAEAEVPAGYRKLDFLESTGTQYIDTGVKLSNESDFKITCEFSASEADGIPHYAFGDSSASVACYAVLPTHYTPHFYLNGTNVYFVGVAQRCVIEYTNNHVILNGVKKFFSNAGEAVTTFENIAVFSSRLGGFPLIGRFYSFSISRAGERQVDYVPCISPEGKLGMYNRVDGTMHENAGRDSFIAGLATREDVRTLYLPETGGELTVSVPADTPDSAVEQLRKNNPNWQIAIQIRTDNEN